MKFFSTLRLSIQKIHGLQFYMVQGVPKKCYLVIWFRELPQQPYCNAYMRFYDQLSNSNVNIHKTDVFGRS